MLHSNRKADGYRTVSNAGYRICLSSSPDGIKWTPIENFLIPKDTEWETVMNEYTCVLPSEIEGKFIVFYNGDGFGSEGFGVLELFIHDNN
jgi:hypothetical protein